MSKLLNKPLPGGSFLMLLLFVAVLVSAIGVSYSAHINRQLLNHALRRAERARQGAGRMGSSDPGTKHLDRSQPYRIPGYRTVEDAHPGCH
ncbi:hypothetical protein ABMD26_001317 [Pseudomonas sp. PvP001]